MAPGNPADHGMRQEAVSRLSFVMVAGSQDIAVYGTEVWMLDSQECQWLRATAAADASADRLLARAAALASPKIVGGRKAADGHAYESESAPLISQEKGPLVSL